MAFYFAKKLWRRLWRHIDGLAPLEERILLGAASLLDDEDRWRFLSHMDAIVHVERGKVEGRIQFRLRPVDAPLLPIAKLVAGDTHLASIEIGYQGKVVPADIWLSVGVLDKIVIRPWRDRKPKPGVFEIVAARKVI